MHIKVRRLGSHLPYQPTYLAMQQFTASRDSNTVDELWLLQHPATYTQGTHGDPEHLLNPGTVPVIAIDRGGQVTYHGPGQWLLYTLLDIRRLGIGAGELVNRLERGVIRLLKEFEINAESRTDAPGVYVDNAKVAAMGLRIKRGRCYHGLSLNVAMDLKPFDGINPCGCPGLQVTDMHRLGISADPQNIAENLIKHLCEVLGYQGCVESDNQLPIPGVANKIGSKRESPVP